MARALLLTLPLAALLVPVSAQSQEPRPHVRSVDCDPAGPATSPRGAVCADEVRLERPDGRALDPSVAAVARLYADVARGDAGAIAAALDDHVMWTGPGGRLVGRSVVAARVAALAAPAPEALGLDASGRVVAVSRRPDGRSVRTVWHLADGLVTGVEQSAGQPAPDL